MQNLSPQPKQSRKAKNSALALTNKKRMLLKEKATRNCFINSYPNQGKNKSTKSIKTTKYYKKFLRRQKTGEEEKKMTSNKH